MASTRQQPTLLGLRIGTVCWFLAFLGTVDAWTTHLLLSGRLGSELNPLMHAIYAQGGVLALSLVKLLAMAPCLLWIGCRAPHGQARAASLAALSIYLPVTLLHIAGLHGAIPL